LTTITTGTSATTSDDYKIVEIFSSFNATLSLIIPADFDAGASQTRKIFIKLSLDAVTFITSAGGIDGGDNPTAAISGL
jgi:hypothetical protein